MPVIAWAINLAIEVYTPRYVAYLAVGVGIAVAAALAALRRPLLRDAAVGAFVIVNLIALPGSLPVRVPYRDIFGAMSAQPGDVVYFADTVEQFLTWQADHYLAPAFTRVEDHNLDCGGGGAARLVPDRRTGSTTTCARSSRRWSRPTRCSR